MRPTARQIAVILGAASQSSPNATTTAAAGAQRGPGGPLGMDVAALATQLGVSSAKVKAALDAVRPAGSRS
jgi:hypothetical protein